MSERMPPRPVVRPFRGITGPQRPRAVPRAPSWSAQRFVPRPPGLHPPSLVTTKSIPKSGPIPPHGKPPPPPPPPSHSPPSHNDKKHTFHANVSSVKNDSVSAEVDGGDNRFRFHTDIPAPPRYRHCSKTYVSGNISKCMPSLHSSPQGSQRQTNSPEMKSMIPDAETILSTVNVSHNNDFQRPSAIPKRIPEPPSSSYRSRIAMTSSTHRFGTPSAPAHRTSPPTPPERVAVPPRRRPHPPRHGPPPSRVIRQSQTSTLRSIPKVESFGSASTVSKVPKPPPPPLPAPRAAPSTPVLYHNRVVSVPVPSSKIIPSNTRRTIAPPQRACSMSPNMELAVLEKDLQQAISSQQFQKCATIRDRINLIKPLCVDNRTSFSSERANAARHILDRNLQEAIDKQHFELCVEIRNKKMRMDELIGQYEDAHLTAISKQTILDEVNAIINTIL